MTLPALFVSHGAPDIRESAPQAVAAMQDIAAGLPVPESVLVVSAHWMAAPVGLTGAGRLETIHDFSGFAPELYDLQYPAQGNEALSARVGALLENSGIAAVLHEERGLDHGAWVPLSIMYPDADIPVVQLSLPAGSLGEAARLGEAIASLREDGVLIVGSGGSVHNLHRLGHMETPEPWASGFEQWLFETIEQGRFEQLIEPAEHSPYFHAAHPTPEHYAPLVTAWAAGDRTAPGKRLHHSYSYGNLGMSHYRFGAG